MNDYNVNIPSRAFNTAYLPYLNDNTPTQLFFGGASSGKSFFVAERVVYDLMNGGRNYLIARKVAKYLKKSIFNEINKVIVAWDVEELFTINKTDLTITCKNGYQALFVGLEDVNRLKSVTPARGVITDILFEEATEGTRDDLKQLTKRLRGRELGVESVAKRLILVFNPVLKGHPLYEDYFSGIGWADDQTEYRDEKLSILKTWYIHNRFLTAEDIDRLENEKDPYYRAVYTFGNWGTLGNLVFRNWLVADLNDPGSAYYLPEAQRTERRPGLDFGFSNDPSASGATHYDKKRKRIYVYGELYERGLTNDRLAEKLKELHGNDYIRADNADPRSIAELRQYGLNVLPSDKGKDSVLHGIQWLQQQTIIIDKSCIKAQNEFAAYKWKEDKNGEAIQVPVDRDNHFIDQLRYAYEADMIEQWIMA